MRCLETGNLVTVGEIMTQAALARKESRFIPYHYRVDYPQTDDERWCGQIAVWQECGTARTEFVPFSQRTES
jgi:succinate dehydrogenase/fumarate reductase flavoprotein subunit